MELVIALGILLSALLPLYGMFSQANRKQINLDYRNRATRIASFVLEKVRSASERSNLIPDEYSQEFSMSVVHHDGQEVSPFFQEFLGSSLGIQKENHPSLFEDLRSFQVEVAFEDPPMSDLGSKCKVVLIKVHWKHPASHGEIRLKELVSVS